MSKETQIKAGVDADNMIKPAFTKKYLDSEKEETGGEFVTLRLNADERRLIDELKRTLNYGQDAKVIKAALIVCRNVVHDTFGEVLMAKLTDPNRRRVLFEDGRPGDKEVNL